MWQEWGGLRRSGNAGIPFLMSSRKYGILLNSSWPSRFAVGKAELCDPVAEFGRNWAPSPWGWDILSGETHPDELSILLDHGIMDLFIFTGDDFESLLTAYVDLTGHAPMPPKWALGFIQCKNRYRSQDELLYLANQFRSRQIPLDVLVIDWLWFKEFGDLQWRSDTFPDPKAAFTRLEKMGVRIMQAQHPFIETNSVKFAEFSEKGFMNQSPEGTRPSYDHSNPAARAAWWQEIKRLYDDGVRAYWTDMGELEVHAPGTRHHLGPRERVHNIYSSLWTRGLYENQRRDFGTRVFSLPRTAYAGIQRNGAAMWSNDISSTWEVFKDQVVIGQGVCLSGQQYWCTDIGGFFMDNTFSPELYIRWFEWGVFCPIFRTHGTRPNNEPWTFGPEAEQILPGFIRLRSRLMPYIYSLAHQVTASGAPIMRAMVVDFPDDPVAIAQEFQFMFGPALLVAPVVEAGARQRKVYLPEGDWYDFWTDQKFNGKQWLDVPAPLGRIPLFVRAGSLVPMGPIMQYADEKPLNNVEVHVYPGPQTCFDLYEDDGATYAYEDGAFALTRISIGDSGDVKSEFIAGDESILPQKRTYTAVLHSAQPAEPYIEVDTDLAMDGACTIHALIRNTGLPAQVKASLYPPDGWHIRSGSASQQAEVDEIAHFQWQLFPHGEALPVLHRADIAFEIPDEQGEQEFSRCITWGSAWAARWQLLWAGDNEDGNGLDRHTLVEDYPEKGIFEFDGKPSSWVRHLAWEHNPFGYVDLKTSFLSGSKLNGVGYARCRIWAQEPTSAFLELAGEGALKVWVNNQQVFSRDAVVLPEVLPDPLNLEQGWNTVLVKVAFNFEKPWSGREFGFNFRLVDEFGTPREDLLYSPS